MREPAAFGKWRKLPSTVQLGIATLFAMVGLGSAIVAVAAYLLENWHVGLFGTAIFFAAFPAAGVVIARDWSNLNWRFRLVGGVWASLGVVPLFLLAWWVMSKWGAHAG